MKKLGILFFVLFITSAMFGGAFIEFFSAKSESGTVKLEWKSGDEHNLKTYLLERKPLNGTFSQIGTLNPKGSNSYYTFSDDNAYKVTTAVYVYRIVLVDSDNTQTYSKEIAVTHTVSSVKKTWGSIKAMFR